MATQSFRPSDVHNKSHVRFFAPIFAGADRADGDARRRASLITSDELLDEIEVLQLMDRTHLPIVLRDRIRALHLAITGYRTNAKLKTFRAAHDLLFALQEPLLAANPRNISNLRRSSRRSPGQPITVTTPIGGTWKLLSLPAGPAPGLSEEWFVLAAAMIERAWERWAYAQHHAIAAARRRSRHARQAIAQSMVAWSNYWQLLDDVDHLRGID